MDVAFLNRNVNEGFSGGEKKRNEILQLSVLEADLAILVRPGPRLRRETWLRNSPLRLRTTLT
jgi:hypothetical protein